MNDFKFQKANFLKITRQVVKKQSIRKINIVKIKLAKIHTFVFITCQNDSKYLKN